MKFYTFYSDSHRELYEDYFLKSFKKCGLDKSFDLDAIHIPQRCPSGDFGSEGFNSTMVDKVSILRRAITENAGEFFIYGDCDIQFFQNFFKDIHKYWDEGLDMLAQSDFTSGEETICAGFVMIKASHKMSSFLDFLHHVTPSFSNDQSALNHYKSNIKYKLLPQNKYFNISSVNNGAVWDGEDDYTFPQEMLLHHANFTIGTKNKIKLLNLVKSQVQNEEV